TLLGCGGNIDGGVSAYAYVTVTYATVTRELCDASRVICWRPDLVRPCLIPGGEVLAVAGYCAVCRATWMTGSRRCGRCSRTVWPAAPRGGPQIGRGAGRE